jgi:hypothetical protein
VAAATRELPLSDGAGSGRFSGGIWSSDEGAATEVFGGTMVCDGSGLGLTEVFTLLGVRSPTGSAMFVS